MMMTMITTTTVVCLKHSIAQTITPGSSFGALFHPATGSGVWQMSPDKPTKSITLLETFHWNSPWYTKDKISNMFQSGRLNHSKLISAVWVSGRCKSKTLCRDASMSWNCPPLLLCWVKSHVSPLMETEQLVMKCHGKLRPHTIRIYCVRGHMRFDAGADSGVCRFLHVPIRMFQESIGDQIVPNFVSGSVLQTAIHGGCSDGWDGPRSHTRFSAKLHVYRGRITTWRFFLTLLGVGVDRF